MAAPAGFPEYYSNESFRCELSVIAAITLEDVDGYTDADVPCVVSV